MTSPSPKLGSGRPALAAAGHPSRQGLSPAEVEERQRAGQVNVAAPPPGRTVSEILRANVLTRFNAILGALLVVVAIVGPVQDGLFGVVLVVNTGIGVFQELRAKRTLDRLQLLTAPKAHVLRQGLSTEVAPEAVVVDDIVELGPGDQVMVDGVLVETDGLELDESLLTGEAEPVFRSPGQKLLSGSFVVAGNGLLRASGVGTGAYAASLEQSARRFSLIRSELQQGTNKTLRLVTWVMIPVGAGLVASQVLWSHQDLTDSLRGSVAGVAAMVPEGLVLLTSLAFALGALRLARRRVLVQELAAIEGLARVDVLCIDKTGTLTTPGMVLQALRPLGSSPRPMVNEALAALTSSDPSPNATMRALATVGNSPAAGWKLESRVPFSSARKWSAATFVDRGTFVLGAPEVVLPGAEIAHVGRPQDRVLVLARTDQALNGTELPRGLVAVASLALSEELRQEARETISYLTEQGITVVVLSGDAPDTVARVADASAVPVVGRPVDAAQLRDDAALRAELQTSTVFGRVRPEQKVSAVKALQRSGHVVAMVGDGVNDIQALKQADLGIAMGSGSESSRAVARVVLLDGTFSAVPDILHEGRRVIANIERVANLFVTKTVYAAWLAAAVALTAVPYPFFPRHLTIVSTFTIGVPGFFLALGGGAPRSHTGFTRRVLTFTVPAGTAAAVATYAAYRLARSSGTSVVESRTAAMLALVTCGLWVLVLVARPIRVRQLVLVVAMAAGVTLPFVVPALSKAFSLAPPPSTVLVGSLGVAVAALTVLTFWRAVSGAASAPGRGPPNDALSGSRE